MMIIQSTVHLSEHEEMHRRGGIVTSYGIVDNQDKWILRVCRNKLEKDMKDVYTPGIWGILSSVRH